MRCPDCNKFVSMEFADPEVSDIQVTEEGEVTAMVTISRTCTECGTELKMSELEMSTDLSKECEEHINKEGEEKHDLTVDENDVNQIEEGGGRYKKAFFGAEVCFTLSCQCDKEWSVEGSMSDKVAASEMEECT